MNQNDDLSMTPTPQRQRPPRPLVRGIVWMSPADEQRLQAGGRALADWSPHTFGGDWERAQAAAGEVLKATDDVWRQRVSDLELALKGLLEAVEEYGQVGLSDAIARAHRAFAQSGEES